MKNNMSFSVVLCHNYKTMTTATWDTDDYNYKIIIRILSLYKI